MLCQFSFQNYRTEELCAQNTTDETQYHAVWSNQCIELWFLLNFSYFHSDIYRKEYWPKLPDWLQSLGKGEFGCLFAHIGKGNQSCADIGGFAYACS